MIDERIRDLAKTLTEYHNDIACKQLLIIMINSSCQVLGQIKIGDIYFAEYFPTSIDRMIERLRQIQTNEDIPAFYTDSIDVVELFFCNCRR